MSEIDRRAVILGGAAGAVTLTITGSSATDVADQAREYLGQSMGWQPIETAPKDGTTVMLYAPDSVRYSSKGIYVGHWEDTESYTPAGGRTYRYGKLVGEDKEARTYTSKRWFSNGYSGGLDSFIPTHWMPLLDPPQTA